MFRSAYSISVENAIEKVLFLFTGVQVFPGEWGMVGEGLCHLFLFGADA